jgi:hypothetical protein
MSAELIQIVVGVLVGVAVGIASGWAAREALRPSPELAAHRRQVRRFDLLQRLAGRDLTDAAPPGDPHD